MKKYLFHVGERALNRRVFHVKLRDFADKKLVATERKKT